MISTWGRIWSALKEHSSLPLLNECVEMTFIEGSTVIIWCYLVEHICLFAVSFCLDFNILNLVSSVRNGKSIFGGAGPSSSCRWRLKPLHMYGCKVTRTKPNAEKWQIFLEIGSALGIDCGPKPPTTYHSIFQGYRQEQNSASKKVRTSATTGWVKATKWVSVCTRTCEGTRPTVSWWLAQIPHAATPKTHRARVWFIIS